ncbi:MAG: peptidase S58 [Dehalococcoidia bacterium]|nr:MAG: peptidase S58 [Dehalococcoidia bacterium]
MERALLSEGSITDVPGIRVGHWTDREAVTGCTVVLADGGAVGGVDVRGSAPGTRETDLLRPGSLVERVNAVVLTGGSAFGLAAADGVMRYLEAHGVGFEARVTRVPIVPAAVLFDLAIGSASVRPDAEAGWLACTAATSGPVEEGCVGVGTGATVAKRHGLHRAVKGGLGSASTLLEDGTGVGVIVAVNAVGAVVDERGVTIATERPGPPGEPILIGNTTLAVVATNARLDKAFATKVAQMAHDGLAIALRPAHTMVDGDTVFALATGERSGPADVTAIGAAAAKLVARAIVRAVLLATPLGGVPSVSTLG